MFIRNAQLTSFSFKQRDDTFSTPLTSPSTKSELFLTPNNAMTRPAEENDRDNGIFFQKPDLVTLPQVIPPLPKISSLEQGVPIYAQNFSSRTKNP